MPEYFYHVHIEVFQTHHLTSDQFLRSAQILAPFMPSTHQKVVLPGASGGMVTGQDSEPSSDDRRIDRIDISAICVDQTDISTGIGTVVASAKTRAVFTAEESALGETGIVHLYRDSEETPGLYIKPTDPVSSHLWDGSASARRLIQPAKPLPLPKQDECNMLAVLAVPSYMSPKDFLAFVGPDTRRAVSHIRMIRTTRLNRYMVLLKFKDARFARQWQHDWNGKVFNSMEPETCHVVFVRGVQMTLNQDSEILTPSTDMTSLATIPLRTGAKPQAPPTPSLVELPTCPVCLERMDESTGLLTVLCQHVFHCSCLEKWSGGGCPVCRYAHDDFSRPTPRPNTKKKYDELRGEFEVEVDGELECGMCHISESLWQCLICGYVGCGRFAGKHAMDHYKRSGHAFAIDLESQRVWDYERDCYVHRIIANSSNPTGEKLIELPGRRREDQQTALFDADHDIDVAKRENLAFEYTQLLTSQLESQRVYFEEIVARAADKVAEASRKTDLVTVRGATIEQNHKNVVRRIEELEIHKAEYEKDISRLTRKVSRLEEQKHGLEKEFQETKQLLDSISASSKSREEAATAQRNALFKKQEQKITDLQNELATRNFYVESLQEQCRDLRMQLDLGKQMSRLVSTGQLTQEELDGATLSAGSAPRSNTSRVQGQAMKHEPTEEEITSSVAESPNLGSVAACVIDKLGCEYTWKRRATESDIIKTLAAVDFLSELRDGHFSITSNFTVDVAADILIAQDLAQKIDRSNVAECLGRAGAALGRNFEVAVNKTNTEIAQVLLDAGIIQPIEEHGLYDSDEPPDNATHTEGARSKRKKKPKKKKK